ncbi:MAG TPA: hypothetical protein VK181_08110 [Rhizobium sp.]|nr:hypothetical protein [Rhizobium sp.]
MFKFFWRRSAWQRSDENPYPQDPLSHPVIASMDQRQIADLPFDPHAFGKVGPVSDASSGRSPKEPGAALRRISLRTDPRRFHNN